MALHIQIFPFTLLAGGLSWCTMSQYSNTAHISRTHPSTPWCQGASWLEWQPHTSATQRPTPPHMASAPSPTPALPLRRAFRHGAAAFRDSALGAAGTAPTAPPPPTTAPPPPRHSAAAAVIAPPPPPCDAADGVGGGGGGAADNWRTKNFTKPKTQIPMYLIPFVFNPSVPTV